MIEVFHGDDFDVEILFGEPLENDIQVFCEIVNNKDRGMFFDPFFVVKAGSTSFTRTLSTKELTPSKDFAPYKYYIRVAIKDEEEKQSTVYQEELFVNKTYHYKVSVTPVTSGEGE